MADPAQWRNIEALDTCRSVKQIDATLWLLWRHQNHTRDMHAAAARLKGVPYACIGVLLSTAVLWIYAVQYQFVVRSFLTIGSVVIASQAANARRLDVAAVFLSMVVLYNPIVPVFGLSGGWHLAIVLGSIIPFAAWLTWLKISS